MISRRTLFIAMLLIPTSTHAQIAVTDGASLLQQLKAFKQEADAQTTRLSQLRNELNMYSNMVTNTASLPQQAWAQVQSDIYQVRNITNGASLLTGNSGNILQRLQSANGYTNQATDFGQQTQMWQQTLANANLQLGRTLGVQQGQEQSYTALQATMQSHSQTAAGQMQAIQAGNELASLTNTQLQQIQTTLTAAIQAQQTRDLVTADRIAAQDATAQAFVSGPLMPTGGYKGF